MITGLNHVDSFLARMAPTAQAVGRQWNIPPSVIIAQAALETGWGQSVKGNAYFGIKQGSSTGESIAFTTHEVIDGKKVTLADRFRAYRSLKDATKAYAQFLHDTPRYQDALRNTSNPARFVEALHRAGYATDPHYAEKLKQIMHRFHLTAYDDVPQMTPPPESVERSAQYTSQRRSGWSEWVSSLPKYLTISESRKLPSLALATHQPEVRVQTPRSATLAAAVRQPAAAGGDRLAPNYQPLPSDGTVKEALLRPGQHLADFPRLLWEQIRQFMWSHGWRLPQLAKSPPDPPRKV